jgi:hypothetical protein
MWRGSHACTLVAGSRESQFGNAVRHLVRWEADGARVAVVWFRLETTALGAAGFLSTLGCVALGVCGHESLLVALVLLRSFVRLIVVAGTVHSSRLGQRTSLSRFESRTSAVDFAVAAHSCALSPSDVP